MSSFSFNTNNFLRKIVAGGVIKRRRRSGRLNPAKNVRPPALTDIFLGIHLLKNVLFSTELFSLPYKVIDKILSIDTRKKNTVVSKKICFLILSYQLLLENYNSTKLLSSSLHTSTNLLSD